MSIMDLNRLYKKDIELLLPGSSQIIRNIGLKKKLAPISPKERVLIIQCPQLNKRKKSPYYRSGELYHRKKDEEIQRIKKVLEMSVERVKSQKMKPLIFPNRTPDPLIRENQIFTDFDGKSPISIKSKKDPAFYPLVKIRKRTLLNRHPLFMITNKPKKQPLKTEYKDANISTETISFREDSEEFLENSN